MSMTPHTWEPAHCLVTTVPYKAIAVLPHGLHCITPQALQADFDSRNQRNEWLVILSG